MPPPQPEYDGFKRRLALTSGTEFSLDFSAAKVSIALRHLTEGESLGTGTWRVDLDLLLDFLRACFKLSGSKDIDISNLGPTRNVNGVANKIFEMAIIWDKGGRTKLPPGIADAALISVARLMRDWQIAQPQRRTPEPEMSYAWTRSVRDSGKILNLVLVKGCTEMENPDYQEAHAALIDRWDASTAVFDSGTEPLVADPALLLESKNQVSRQLLTLVHRWTLDGRWDFDSSRHLLLMIEFLWVEGWRPAPVLDDLELIPGPETLIQPASDPPPEADLYDLLHLDEPDSGRPAKRKTNTKGTP